MGYSRPARLISRLVAALALPWAVGCAELTGAPRSDASIGPSLSALLQNNQYLSGEVARLRSEQASLSARLASLEGQAGASYPPQPVTSYAPQRSAPLLPPARTCIEQQDGGVVYRDC